MPIWSQKVAASVLCALFAGWFLYEIATDLVEKGVASGGALYNAAFVPNAYALLLLALLAIKGLTDFTCYRRDRDPGSSSKPHATPAFPDDEEIAASASRQAWFRVVLVSALLVTYVMILQPLGYLLATPVFIILLGLALGERRLLALVIWALLLSFGLAAVFGMLFNVVLPVGFMELEL